MKLGEPQYVMGWALTPNADCSVTVACGVHKDVAILRGRTGTLPAIDELVVDYSKPEMTPKLIRRQVKIMMRKMLAEGVNPCSSTRRR